MSWYRHNQRRIDDIRRFLFHASLSNTTIESEKLQEVKDLIDALVNRVIELENKIEKK